MAIKDILMYEESLFRQMSVFDPDFIPETFNYRKEQLESMALAIRPVFQKSRPGNLLIIGPCATGKTTSIKKVFEEVNEVTEDLICVPVNCQLNPGRFQLIKEIHKQVLGYEAPVSGLSFKEIYNKIMKKLKNQNKSLLLALDDANVIFEDKESQDFLYMLLRTHEKFPSVYVGIFMVVSDSEYTLKLDRKTSTLFLPREVTFPQYSYNETYNILQDRAKIGFRHDVISEELIDIITDYTYETGDLREGINLLKEAGLLAESEASREITEEHVNQAIDNHISESLKVIVSTLNEDEITILKLIYEEIEKLPPNEVLKSTRITYRVKSENLMGYTKCTKIIIKLDFLKLIDTTFSGKGKHGKTKLIYPRFKVDDVNKILNNS